MSLLKDKSINVTVRTELVDLLTLREDLTPFVALFASLEESEGTNNKTKCFTFILT